MGGGGSLKFCTCSCLTSAANVSVVSFSLGCSMHRPVTISLIGSWLSSTQRMLSMARSPLLTRLGCSDTDRSTSSCGDTNPLAGDTVTMSRYLVGISKAYLAPRSPKLCRWSFLVAVDPRTTAPKRRDCSESLISVAWQTPEMLTKWTCWPKLHIAWRPNLNGATLYCGAKKMSTGIDSLGRRDMEVSGFQEMPFSRNASPLGSCRAKSTARCDRLTRRMVLVREDPPVVTPKSTFCISIEASSRRNWHPRPRTFT
mmetsp:Transcript_25002/g.63827  ORF Transcript_25002/g.63827 Transcript_25002/m.63827 type:complete len:256 (+) Transcript_25002:1587-2354(+)